MLNSLIPLPTFAPPQAEQAPDLPGARSASAVEDDSVNAPSDSARVWTTPGASSARHPDLTAPLSLLALIGASGALVAESKRRKPSKKEKSGLSEVQRRHQSKVEKRWKEEAEKEAARKRLDSHRGADSKIDRMEAAEAAAILAAQEAKRKKDEPLDSATQSYMAWGKAIEDGKFDTQKYAEEMEKLADETRSQEKTWWEKIGNGLAATATNTRDNIARVMGAIPDAWRGVLLSPLQIRKQVKGSNLVVSVNQRALDVVSSVTGWMERNLPWTGVKAMPSNKLGFYESLAEQGLDIKPTGNLSPKSWIDDLLDIVLGRESKTLVKEAAEETAETAAKGGLRNALKTASPNVFDAVIEGAFNAYDYTLGEKKNETDKLQKWAVSSGVDLGGSLATGALAALTVAGVIATISYFAGAPVTIPATGVIVLTILAGAGLDMALEATGIKDVIKNNLNTFIDGVQALPAPLPAQPALPVQTTSDSPQIHETPTPSAPVVQPVLQSAPAQTPPTPMPQTPEP